MTQKKKKNDDPEPSTRAKSSRQNEAEVGEVCSAEKQGQGGRPMWGTEWHSKRGHGKTAAMDFPQLTKNRIP